MKKQVDLKALYFGTPVVLISTMNENGTPNLAPMSSAWWLGNTTMLGLSTRGKTFENLEKQGEAVLNIPTPELVANVNDLAMTTGKNPVPEYKEKMGYRYEPTKFEIAHLTPAKSMIVKPPMVKEAPVNLEVKVKNIHRIGHKDHHLASIEVEVIKVHIDDKYLVPGTRYVDTDKWSPLIMSFTEFFGLTSNIHPSKLADAWFPKVKEIKQKITLSNRIST